MTKTTKHSKEDINKIINLKGADGKLIDIFDLHGVLHVGNSENSTWDLSKTYTCFSEHSLGISTEDFDGCETEDDVNEKFCDSLKMIVKERLL